MISTVIIDYGMGNVGSIANMIKKAGGRSIISSDINVIEQADRLILPGVGAFDTGMKQLRNSSFFDVLNKKAIIERIPVLGICLGMQLMTKSSEEGSENGLAWIEADTRKFNFADFAETLRIPHMGWNTVIGKKNHPFIKEMDPGASRFYFVHSYYVNCHSSDDVLLTCHYGIEFTAAFQKDNIVGVQFHPEKSHKFGMKMFKNFLVL